MSPTIQDHAAVAVHGEVQGYSGEMLVQDVTDDLSFDFGEGSVSGPGVSARSDASPDCVPVEIVVAVAIDSGTHTAERVGVGGASLAPEAVLEK